MEIGKRARLSWHRFGDLPAVLLYEVLRFRQGVFVVEQRSPYPDLDGLDACARHLLLRVEGELAGYLRLIPNLDAKRVAIGRVAVAAPLRRHRLARLMMTEALARCRQDYPECALILSAQAHLASFYESLGFRVTSPSYDDYGVSHVDMASTHPTADGLRQNGV